MLIGLFTQRILKMYKGKKILAIIPARAGSKGLAQKNILPLAGKPMIEWSIQAALESQYLDKVIVSTDGEEIANIAKKAKAHVPMLRPCDLASDEASSIDVILHALEHMTQGEEFDYFLVLQPTSPLRTSVHIDKAIDYFFQHQQCPEQTLVSVIALPDKMAWAMHMNQSGCVTFVLPQESQSPKQRQSLPRLYLPNGALYLSAVSTFQKTFYNNACLPFLMTQEDSIDVDTQEDFNLVQKILQSRIGHSKELASSL